MFRSVNPMNMYPLPQAGNQFVHSARWKGTRLALKKNDLGETDEILACLVAFLEEKYRNEGHADDFAAYANAAHLDLEPRDLAALRRKSREVHVTIAPARNLCNRSRVDPLSYEAFKEWALGIVRRHGHGPVDFFVCGEPCDMKIAGGGRPLVHIRLDGFEEDDDKYNTVYRVARDTRVSALAYFLLLDNRHHSDCNALFRPDMSRTGGSLKPLLAFTNSDIHGRVIPHLSLYSGEVKGWNVLSQDSAGSR